MGYADELFVTLRSTDSKAYFPDNTAGDFYVCLPYCLKFEGEWSVGVNDIWITKHWFNLVDEAIFLSFSDQEYERFQINDGLYTSNSMLIDELNAAARGACDEPCLSVSLNLNNHKVSIQTRKDVKLKLSSGLSELFGIKDDYVISGGWTSRTPLDVNVGNRFVMVYTDFVSSQLFSDEMLSVVKIVDCSYGTLKCVRRHLTSYTCNYETSAENQ
jgi:hypothetical protein